MQEINNKKEMIDYFKNNNLSLKIMLKNIFNKNIIRITYLGNVKLRAMEEYKFNLLKFNIVLEDYSNYSIFIRLIEDYQIEENLFCYWLLCEENYSFNTKFYIPKANILNYKKDNCSTMYKLQLLSKNKKVWKSSFVEIINLDKYLKQKINKKRNSLVETNKFLFIAIL